MSKDVLVAYRRSFPRWGMALVYSVFLLVFVSGLFVSWGDSEAPASWSQRLLLAPLVVANAWLVVRAIRQGVWVQREGLLIRNQLRTYDVPWSEIRSIEPPPAYGAMRNAGIRVHLRDGSIVSAGLFAAGLLNRPTHSDAVVEGLRSYLQRFRNPDTANVA